MPAGRSERPLPAATVSGDGGPPDPEAIIAGDDACDEARAVIGIWSTGQQELDGIHT